MNKNVIVITGASSGIGYKTGEYLVKKGYKVYGLSRTERPGAPFPFIKCDVTDKEEVRKAFGEIKEEIYAVINNAGIGISGPVEYESKENIQKIIDVNILGAVNVSQIAIPYLRKTKGRIINIGSVAQDFTIPFQTFYSITKAAINALTEGLRAELRPFGIKATTVLPGDTKSSFTVNRIKQDVHDDVYKNRVEVSLNRMEKDEQKGKDPITVARVVARVLKRKNPPLKVTVGFSYKLLVFLKRLLPVKTVNNIVYRLYGGKSNE